MTLFTSTPKACAMTLKVCAHLLGYPGADLRAHLGELHDALHSEKALGAERLAELDTLIQQLQCGDPLEVESQYVELFDRGRATSLHLFEHVHGDSRDLGPAMIDLAQTYEKAGLYLSADELPDYLPVVLQFASTQPSKEARAFLGEMTHILNAVFAALQQRNTAYASVLAGLLEIAGEKPHAVKLLAEESLDATWQEPVAFDGCNVAGQAKPGQPQPIHIVPIAQRTRVAAQEA